MKKYGVVVLSVLACFVVVGSVNALSLPSTPNPPAVPSVPPTPYLPPTPQLPPCPECDDFVVEPTPTATALATPTYEPTNPPSSGTGGSSDGGGGGGASSSDSSGGGGASTGAVLGTTGYFEEGIFTFLFTLGSVLTAVGIKKQYC